MPNTTISKAGKSGGKGLSPEQNEALREVLRGVMHAERITQRELERRIGTSQATLSSFLSGRQGTGLEIAIRICELASVDYHEVLKLPRGVASSTTDTDDEERALVSRVARSNGYAQRVIDFVCDARRVTGRITHDEQARLALEWADRALREFDRDKELSELRTKQQAASKRNHSTEGMKAISPLEIAKHKSKKGRTGTV